jgi:hypothetical protein
MRLIALGAARVEGDAVGGLPCHRLRTPTGRSVTFGALLTCAAMDAMLQGVVAVGTRQGHDHCAIA